MAEIVNLRRARKAKARQDDAASAAENRTRFGRSKTERQKSAAIETLVTRALDGHKLDPSAKDKD